MMRFSGYTIGIDLTGFAQSSVKDKPYVVTKVEYSSSVPKKEKRFSTFDEAVGYIAARFQEYMQGEVNSVTEKKNRLEAVLGDLEVGQEAV